MENKLGNIFINHTHHLFVCIIEALFIITLYNMFLLV